MNDSRQFALRSIGVVVVLLLLVAASPLVAGDRNKATPPAPAPARDPAQYVGAETCKRCHEEVYKKFETTPHWKTTFDTRREKEWQGCEACHGPSSGKGPT